MRLTPPPPTREPYIYPCKMYMHGILGNQYCIDKIRHTVVSKLITDRHLSRDELISNYRYRIALPEELISITETDLVGISAEHLSPQIQIRS